MSARYRTEYRDVVLRRRDKTSLPFGSPAASIAANRNLLYLAAKGVIPALVPSARVAQELTAANIAKQQRVQNRRSYVGAMKA